MAKQGQASEGEQSKTLYLENFSGIIQRQDFDKIPNSASPMLQNVSLDKPGTLAKRKGSKLLGAAISPTPIDGVQCAITYLKSTGERILRKIVNTNLYIYDSVTDSWTLSISGCVSDPTTKVQAVVFKDRVYYISAVDFLWWEDGTGVKHEIGTGTDRLTGTDITSAQNTLYVLNGNTVYYSLYGSSWDVGTSTWVSGQNAPGDQFWEDGQNLTTTTRAFTLPEPGVGLIKYIGGLYIFTDIGGYTWDILQSVNETGANPVINQGLVNPRAKTICNDVLVWMSPDGRIWAWGGAGIPMLVSYPIEDDEHAKAIINLIDPNELQNVCAGSDRSKFYFRIGTITFYSETYTNAVIVGHVNQNFTQVNFSLFTYPWDIQTFANAYIGNQRVLTMGDTTLGNMYRMSYGVRDDNQAITMTAKIAFWNFGTPIASSEGSTVYIKYRPQVATDANPNVYLKLRYALNGSYEYQDLSDPDGSGLEQFGKLDMALLDDKSQASSTDLDATGFVYIPPSEEFRTFSLELANSQMDEGTEISALAIEIMPRGILDNSIG